MFASWPCQAHAPAQAVCMCVSEMRAIGMQEGSVTHGMQRRAHNALNKELLHCGNRTFKLKVPPACHLELHNPACVVLLQLLRGHAQVYLAWLQHEASAS